MCCVIICSLAIRVRSRYWVTNCRWNDVGEHCSHLLCPGLLLACDAETPNVRTKPNSTTQQCDFAAPQAAPTTPRGASPFQSTVCQASNGELPASCG